MVEKSNSFGKSKNSVSIDFTGMKQSESSSLPQSQIKMLDGNYTDKERRQVVLKLIRFMKAT
jgi:hypothetical protein